jgi:hypothetical protein
MAARRTRECPIVESFFEMEPVRGDLQGMWKSTAMSKEVLHAGP